MEEKRKAFLTFDRGLLLAAVVIGLAGDGIACLYGVFRSFSETPFWLEWTRSLFHGVCTVMLQYLFYRTAKQGKPEQAGNVSGLKCSKGALCLLAIGIVLQVIIGPLLVSVQSFAISGAVFVLWAVTAAVMYYLGRKERVE